MAGPVTSKADLPDLTAAQREQLKALEKQLRCLVCQNQTLADSGADLAGDLRNVVHRQVAQGRTDAQIKDYLVQRYGDYVLYNPPVKNTTALLWGGPFALLAIGAGTWFMVGRRQARARAQSDAKRNEMPSANPSGATENARKTAAELLNKNRP